MRHRLTRIDIEEIVAHTYPPGIKKYPAGHYFILGDGVNWRLFEEVLESAVMESIHKDSHLLEALRKKWPKAVDGELSETKKNVKAMLREVNALMALPKVAVA